MNKFGLFVKNYKFGIFCKFLKILTPWKFCSFLSISIFNIFSDPLQIFFLKFTRNSKLWLFK